MAAPMTVDQIDELLGSGVSSPLRAVDSLERSAPMAVSAVSAMGAASEKPAHAGAKVYDRMMATWRPPLSSMDRDILPEKTMLDARTRDIFRNDAYVQGGGVLHQDNIVGSLYLLNAKPKTKVLWGSDDPVWEAEYQEEVETKFMLSAESDANWLDASQIGTLTEMTRVVVGTFVARNGEALATAEWLRETGRPFNTAVQLIDPDRLSDPRDRVYDEKVLRRGIERNARGAPLAYYIQNGHPSDFANVDTYTWRRVERYKPWGRPMVLHIFDRKGPDQTRGIPAFAAALAESRMAREFRGVVLQNAILNATIAASIESELPPETVFASFGATGGNPYESFAESHLDMVGDFSSGSQNLKLDGARIPHMFPGTKLKLHPAGQGGPLGTDFEKSLLRYLASSLGVSYEQLSRDYTSTNYSSARAAMTETWKFMQARKKMVADRFANFVYRLWLEEQINRGRIEALKRRNVPSFYDGLNAEAYTHCEWIGAARGQIDELKETQAAVLRIQNRLSTREYEIARSMGGDWRMISQQIAREEATDTKLGLQPIVMSTNRPSAGAPDNNSDTQGGDDATQ